MSKYKNGTTYFELLLVIGLIALIAAITTPYMINFTTKRNLDHATDTIVNVLRLAQMNSITEKDGQGWGVCIKNDEIVLYSDNCNSPIHQEIYYYPKGIDIDGFTDITFSRDRGEPSSKADILISNRIETVEIYLNSIGGLSR